jgi:non-canonical (house-cleaning) NTP pyrophosphatase
VTDGQRWGYGAGGAVLVPAAVAERVLAGEELGDVIDALAGAPTRGTRGAWGVLTRDLVGRRDAFRLAVLAAFAPFYNRSVWTS